MNKLANTFVMVNMLGDKSWIHNISMERGIFVKGYQ